MRSPPRDSWASIGATTRNSSGPSHSTEVPPVPLTSPHAAGRPPVTDAIRAPASELGSTRRPDHGQERDLAQFHGARDGAGLKCCAE